MVQLSKIAVKFSDQLLTLYESNQYHILDLFRMYIGFILKYGGHAGNKDMRLIMPWQMKDMEMSIWNDKIDYRLEPLETVVNANRRSGKTEFRTVLAVFFGLLNKEVKWRSAYMRQQKEAKIWFHLNPFIRRINNMENLVYLYGKSYYPIDMGVLSPGNVTGVECDVVFFDEGGWVFRNLQLYEAYRNARPMVAASDFKHIIHLSTPARYSAFQEAEDAVRSYANELGTQLAVLRTWEDCPWITPEFLAYEERMNADCPWYVDQNYRGIYVVYGGAVFSNFYDINDTVHVSDDLREWFGRAKPTHGGVDWNGEFTKHYLGLYFISDDYIFAKEEIKFLDINLLKKYEKKISLELEDEDPWSDSFADDAKQLGILCNYFGWNDEKKSERIRQAKSRTIIVDKKECPQLWKNLQEAAYDQHKRLPSLEKRTDQHGLDNMLHAMHAGEGVLTVPPYIKKRRQQGWSERGKYASY